MERLTERHYKKTEGYYVKCSKYCEKEETMCIECERSDEIVDRLGAIEDILGDNYDLDRLRELAQADKEGRCVVLPCEVGSTVYMPFCDEVVEKGIGQFLVNGYTEPRIWTDIDCDWATTQRVRWDLAFGKTVFLTREDAEAALRREQDG